MHIKLNEITSKSLTKQDAVQNMVKRYQGLEVEGSEQALKYTIDSRSHAIKKLESEFMAEAREGRSFTRDGLYGSYQADIDSVPVIISTPLYYSFKKSPAFESVFAQDNNLYLRAQLLMWATHRTNVIVCQWSPLQSLIEKVVYDPDFVDMIALPYLEEIKTMFNEQKETPVYVVRDDLQYIIDQINEYDAQIEILNDLRKEQLEILQEESAGNNLKIGDVEFKLVERKGSIDYKKYAKEHGIDFEDYRKTSSQYWRLFK